MKYKALTENKFTLNNYALVPFRKADLLLIKKWRNEQITILRQKTLLTDEDQINYYRSRIESTFTQEKPGQILFSFLHANNCIGYGGLTNIDWESKRTEMSFLVDTFRISDPKLYANDFSAFINLIKKVVFEDLKFNRLFTETYDIRPLHVLTLERNGFNFEGRMKEHVYINSQFVDSLIHGILRRELND